MRFAAALAVVFAATTLVQSQPRAQNIQFPAVPELNFAVFRNGSEVGYHRARFTREGDALKVAHETLIEVTLLGAVLYRYKQDVTETWRNGKLVICSAETNDDGKITKVEIRGGVGITLDGKPVPLPASFDKNMIIPSSLWNPALVESKTQVDLQDGRILSVSVQAIGEETVTVRGAPIPARHFRLTGDLMRDLWYDRANRAVQAGFSAKDKSAIRLTLK